MRGNAVPFAAQTYPQARPGSPLTPNILSQPSIFIDRVNGSDSNGGTTALTPLKTWREYWKRMSLAAVPFLAIFLQADQAVQYLDTLTAADARVTSDPVFLSGYCINNQRLLTIRGTFKEERASTFTAATQHVLGGNVPFQATDPTVVSWATDVGKIVLQAGPKAFLVDKDLGAGAARFSQPMTDADVFFAALTTITVGAYQMGTYTSIITSDLCVSGGGQAFAGEVRFDKFAFGDGSNEVAPTVNAPLSGVITFTQCIFHDYVSAGHDVWMQNCWFGLGFGSVFAASSDNAIILGGSHDPAGFFTLSGGIIVDGNFYLKSPTSVFTIIPARIGLLALLDNAALNLQFGTTMLFKIYAFGARSIWGNTAAASVFISNNGSSFIWGGAGFVVADCPIVGAQVSNDKFGATSFPFDPAGPGFAAAAATTLANIAAAPPGGYGGTLADPRLNSSFGD